MPLLSPFLFPQIATTRKTGAGLLTNALSFAAMTLLAVSAIAQSPAADDRPARKQNSGLQSRPPGSSRVKLAVIVGVDDYGSNINRLNYAVADAKKIYAALTDPAIGGAARERVRLLTSDSPAPEGKPTRANIERALLDVAKLARPQDQFWFYFAGHGICVRESSFLLPSDVRLSQQEFEKSALRAKFVRDTLDRICKAREKIVILDACQSGSLRSIAVTPRLESAFQGPGIITIAACDVNESAIETPRLGGGIFTYYLVRGLKGEARTKAVGPVTALDMKRYLPERVQQFAQKCARIQTPQFIPRELDLKGDIPLALQDGSAPSLTPEILKPDQIEMKKPLGPTLVIALSEQRMQLSGQAFQSEITEIEIKRLLLRQNFPLLDKAVAQSLLQNQDAKAAGVQAGEQGARFLLIGQVTTSASSVVAGFITVNVTLSAQLVDEAGRVLDAVNINTTKASVTEGKAATEALQEAAAHLVEAMQTKIKEALKEKAE